MEAVREEDFEFLASLEERIRKAVELVASLRKENEGLKRQLDAAIAAKTTAEQGAKDDHAALRKEIDTLKAERKHVRARVEKLLGQMDLLGAS